MEIKYICNLCNKELEYCNCEDTLIEMRNSEEMQCYQHCDNYLVGDSVYITKDDKIYRVNPMNLNIIIKDNLREIKKRFTKDGNYLKVGLINKVK